LPLGGVILSLRVSLVRRLRAEENAVNVSRPRKLFAAAGMLCVLIACSCDEYPAEQDQNPDGAKLGIRVQSGDNQRERVGANLPDPIVVRVSEGTNNPKPGIGVSFVTSDRGASVVPSQATTDGNGLASCTFRLGAVPGAQHVLAFIQDDTTTVAATADAILCLEESPARVCTWNAGHIYVATTNSSLLSLGTGSVILDFNPATQEILKVLETPEMLDGLAFSSRGELFATAYHKIFKVNHATGQLENFILYDEDWHMSIGPNEGGILAGVCEGGPLTVDCPADGFTILLPPHVFPSIQWENLAVDQLTRDIFIIDRFGALNFKIWRIFWDGRSSVRTFDVYADLSVGPAEPRGMCSDSSGTIYVTFDGNADYRRIVSVSADGSIDYDFFDFYARAGGDSTSAGRWGDVACLNGRLYLIDRRNDRLVIISRTGEWLAEVKNDAFSKPFDESEHYSIAASPSWICTMAK
jgi:hypothetical protein